MFAHFTQRKSVDPDDTASRSGSCPFFILFYFFYGTALCGMYGPVNLFLTLLPTTPWPGQLHMVYAPFRLFGD